MVLGWTWQQGVNAFGHAFEHVVDRNIHPHADTGHAAVLAA